MSTPNGRRGIPTRRSIPGGPSSRPARVPWTPFERARGLLFVALVSTLTLEWISLGAFLTTRDIKYFHLFALAFMAVCLARHRPSHSLSPILVRYRAFYGPWLFYLLLTAVVGLAHVEPYFDRSEVVRQAFYGATSVFVAGFCLEVDGRKVRRVLQWTGVVTIGVAVGGISASLLGQGANPVRLIGEALARGNPDIVSYRLLRLSFRSQELVNAGANLRHKVFAAVLIGLAVALICRERPRGAYARWRDRFFLVAAACGALLVVLSLSRSLIVSLGIILGLYGLRMFIERRASPRQLAVTLAALVAIVMLAASPVGSLLWARFGDTGSYQGRTAAVRSAIQPTSVEAAILGAEASDVEKSPHNLILDAWLSAGVLGAVSTMLFLFAYLRVWMMQARRYVTGAPGWTLSLHQFWVVAVGVIPLVRAITAGNGLHMNDWVCMGIVFGLVEANRRTAAERLGQRANLLQGPPQLRARLTDGLRGRS